MGKNNEKSELYPIFWMNPVMNLKINIKYPKSINNVINEYNTSAKFNKFF